MISSDVVRKRLAGSRPTSAARVSSTAPTSAPTPTASSDARPLTPSSGVRVLSSTPPSAAAPIATPSARGGAGRRMSPSCNAWPRRRPPLPGAGPGTGSRPDLGCRDEVVERERDRFSSRWTRHPPGRIWPCAPTGTSRRSSPMCSPCSTSGSRTGPRAAEFSPRREAQHRYLPARPLVLTPVATACVVRLYLWYANPTGCPRALRPSPRFAAPRSAGPVA